MKFLISGASSTLAQKIGRQLTSVGHEVKIIGRGTSPEFNLEVLGKDVLELFNYYDTFIHLAHSHQKQEPLDINELAAIKIKSMLSQPGVSLGTCIYISSDSANASAKSSYGKSKYRTERVFLESNKSSVLRLGVITDNDIKSPYQLVKRFSTLFGVLIFPKPHSDIFSMTSVNNIVKSVIYISENNITGGPFGIGEELNGESMFSILRRDNVKLKVVVGIPSPLIKVFCFFGKKNNGLNRISDSLLSIQVRPEEKMKLFP